jgi:heme/copper-type cytochrome/quinol oxidase subunit 2
MADDTGTIRRPRMADVAFGLTLAVAAAVLVIAGLVPAQIAPTIDRSRSAANAQQVDVPALQHGLVLLSVVLIVVGVVVAGLLVLFAFRVRGGHRRARIGVVVITVLLIASLDVQLIVAAVVLAVADVLMFLPPVAEWLRAVAPKRALRRR